jgi:Nitronate monooxygenase
MAKFRRTDSMALRTKLTEKLGISHPILLAPMGTAPGGTLAKAVTQAGGLGIIGFGYGNQERIDQEFWAVGNARVGCGFIRWSLATSRTSGSSLGSQARSRHDRHHCPVNGNPERVLRAPTRLFRRPCSCVPVAPDSSSPVFHPAQRPPIGQGWPARRRRRRKTASAVGFRSQASGRVAEPSCVRFRCADAPGSPCMRLRRHLRPRRSAGLAAPSGHGDNARPRICP